MKWTYSGVIEHHHANNFYFSDSLYQVDYKYKYNLADLWVAWNFDADKPDTSINNLRLRKLVGVRLLQQNFTDKPGKYYSEYFYAYADLKGVLADFSLFKQNTYKTKYVYGFGRNEDVPEGMEASITTGWTKKDDHERAYAGINFQRYYFNQRQDYLSFLVGTGAFLYKNKPEDIDVLGKIDFFTRLHSLKRKWKQRIFLSAGAARQINSTLSEPLRLESDYGLRELKNNYRGGNLRIAFKGESVFYSPWSVLLFRFAPFVFANAVYFNFKLENDQYDGKLYSSLGAGFRVRNESLIFGTIEFRGMYFPRKDFYNESWRFEAKTGIRFKYNRELINKPDFVRMN